MPERRRVHSRRPVFRRRHHHTWQADSITVPYLLSGVSTKRGAVLLVPFLLVPYLLVPFILHAQNICGTPEDRTLIAGCDQHTTFDNYPPDSTVGPVRVKFHVIRHSDESMDSTTGRLLTDSLLSLIGAQVKAAFEDDSVRIALDIIPGCDWIDDEDVYSTMVGQPTATVFTVSLPRDTGNAVNVYFGPSIGLSFAAYNPGIPFGSVYIAGDHYYNPALGYHGVTVIHEIGHVFGLYHTFHQYNQNAENIARTNCYTAGDRLCDTRRILGLGTAIT